MLQIKEILLQIENSIDDVISGDDSLGRDLWKILLGLHHADIATLVLKLSDEHQIALFKKLPRELAAKVFRKISEPIQADVLVAVEIDYAALLLKSMPIDELTDLFDHLSDEDLEKYLKLFAGKTANPNYFNVNI